MGAPGSDPDVTPEDILGVFEQNERQSAPFTAAEVGERLGCSRRTARRTLEDLVTRGKLEARDVSPESRVWWQPDGSADAADSRDGAADAAGGTHRGIAADQFAEFVRAVEDYAIFALDPDGRVASWNQGAERIKGYEEREILGEHFSEFYTESDRRRGVPRRNLDAAAEQGRAEDEGWRVRKDGTEFWARVVITAIHDDDGNLRGFTKVTRDLTERRRREQQLRRESKLTEQILKTAPVAISVQDADGETVLANERARELLGPAEDGADGEPEGVDWELQDVDGEPIDADETPTSRVLATGEPVLDEELTLERPDGDRQWLAVNAVPMFDAEGDLERVVTAGKDITRQKEQTRQLERQRDELEAELDEVYDRVTDAFYALDEEWRFTYVNERAEEIIEQNEAEVLGESVWEVLPELADSVARERYREAMTTQEPVNFEMYHESLDAWIEFNAYPSETGLSVYFRDVTERVEHEQELASRASQQRAVSELGRRALENPDLDALFERAAGLVADELDNEYCKVLDLDPEREELLLRQGVGWRDGLVGEATVSAVADNSQASWTLSSEEPVVVEDLASETRFSGPELLTSHGVRSGISTVIGSREDPWGILGTHDTERNSFTAEDISFVQGIANVLAEAIERQQYREELEELVQELEASNERLEGFASMLAHELRNPVTIGQMYSQQLPVDADDEAFDHVTEAFDRIEDMIDVMLVLTRGGEAAGEQTQVAVDDAARAAWEDVDTPDATLEVTVGGSVQGDGTYIRHLFENLFKNAVEHGGSDVTVTVGDLPTGFYVADDGDGIPPGERDAVFDTGYTTAAGAGGTGLGLAFVRELAETYDWEYEVTESAGGGARFEFRQVDRATDGN